MFSQSYRALTNEALFTKELLGAGATQIRKAHYAAKGVYFQAFTNLSTGLERLGKLCLLIDFYIENGAVFPDDQYVRLGIGHDIMLISNRLDSIRERRSLTERYPSDVGDPIHQAILGTLSRFAKGDRYANIDLLVGSSRQSNPIQQWNQTVDEPLFASHVPARLKQKISARAQAVSQLTANHAFIMHTSETGITIDDVLTASELTGRFEAVAPLRQLLTLQIIRHWVEILCGLQYAAMSVDDDGDIPYFSEIFAGFRVDDVYLRTRKIWPG